MDGSEPDGSDHCVFLCPYPSSLAPFSGKPLFLSLLPPAALSFTFGSLTYPYGYREDVNGKTELHLHRIYPSLSTYIITIQPLDLTDISQNAFLFLSLHSSLSLFLSTSLLFLSRFLSLLSLSLASSITLVLFFSSHFLSPSSILLFDHLLAHSRHNYKEKAGTR